MARHTNSKVVWCILVVMFGVVALWLLLFGSTFTIATEMSGVGEDDAGARGTSIITVIPTVTPTSTIDRQPESSGSKSAIDRQPVSSGSESAIERQPASPGNVVEIEGQQQQQTTKRIDASRAKRSREQQKTKQNKAKKNREQKTQQGEKGNAVEIKFPVQFRDDPACRLDYFTNKTLEKQCAPTRRGTKLLDDSMPTHVVSQRPTPSRTISLVDLQQRLLRKFWGPSPPSVDIYLRTGCGKRGFVDLEPLFDSAELFWPNFLGRIVIVLDAGDTGVSLPIPKHTKHHYKIVYEYVPKFEGDLVNGYAYLHADKHCDAEYILTIDSDCVFFCPVTPRFLFKDFGTERMRVILSSSSSKKSILNWDKAVNFFFMHNMSGYGKGWNRAKAAKGCEGGGTRNMRSSLPTLRSIHNFMLTQPLTFRRDTFARWRAFITERNGMSFGAQVVIYDEMRRQQPCHYVSSCPKKIWTSISLFCFMCFLGNWILFDPSESKKYLVIDWHGKHTEGTLFFVAHVKYDFRCISALWPTRHQLSIDQISTYPEKAYGFIRSGLCQWLGHNLNRSLPECTTKMWYSRWRDASERIMLGATVRPYPEIKARAWKMLFEYRDELQAAYDELELTFA